MKEDILDPTLDLKELELQWMGKPMTGSVEVYSWPLEDPPQHQIINSFI